MASGGCPFGHGTSVKQTSDKPVVPRRGKDPVYYHSYLGLEKILTAQVPLSQKIDNHLAHDEMLFIITHQTYELWFKQMIYELDSCLSLFDQPDERQMLTIVNRLKRITVIQRTLLSQLTILETMTPLDFLEFRDYLFPASGFQSVQFRQLENKLGLRGRHRYGKRDYKEHLTPDHSAFVAATEKEKSLFEVVEAWLERTPCVGYTATINPAEDTDSGSPGHASPAPDGYCFAKEYQKVINKMNQDSRDRINEDERLTAAEKEEKIKLFVEPLEDTFSNLFSAKKHRENLERARSHGDTKRRLSHKALWAAIFISLYRDEPIFQAPFQLLTLLTDVDELLTQWRQGHALMVQRMLGNKPGTGGSSGAKYLLHTAIHHKIFDDLTNCSVYMISKALIPELPEAVKTQFRFHFTTTAKLKMERLSSSPV